jgi:hypothetical protein
MIGGSFASAAHGVPRSTNDADLVVDLPHSQAQDLVKAFQKDFYVDLGQVEHAIAARTSFNMIHLESFYKTDLFVLGEGEFAREEFSRRILEPLEGMPAESAYLATAEDTILSKLDWYRQGGRISDQQWRDVLGILKVQRGLLDLAYLRKWAEKLKLEDLLKEAFTDAGTGEDI